MSKTAKGYYSPEIAETIKRARQSFKIAEIIKKDIQAHQNCPPIGILNRLVSSGICTIKGCLHSLSDIPKATSNYFYISSKNNYEGSLMEEFGNLNVMQPFILIEKQCESEDKDARHIAYICYPAA